MSLHDSRKQKNPAKRPFSPLLFWHNNRKWIKQLLFLILILIVLFFPIWTGALIGNWIKDFLGTIVNIVKTI